MSITRSPSPIGQTPVTPGITSDSSYLHVHFGAGRLGLGLVVPFFRKQGAETWILNRAVAGTRETGETTLSSARRNELLMRHPERVYKVQKSGRDEVAGQRSEYDRFITYTGDDIRDTAQNIAHAAATKEAGVIVTASILKPEHYEPVMQVLDVLGSTPEAGRIFVVACENTISAHDVLSDAHLSKPISLASRDRITCVHALVDRMCVGMEEDDSEAYPTVRVCAEDYGLLKLEQNEETEELVEWCAGSKVQFSRHVDTEKQIKSWLLNGSHWLIALDAYDAVRADKNLKLNEYLSASPKNAEFAADIVAEVSEGVAILLRSDPQYRRFRQDIDIDDYLMDASRSILDRFHANEDPITRILARFQAPSANSFASIQSFAKRFSDRVDAPMRAYESENGAPPAASIHCFQSLFRLVSSGSFIDAAA